MVHRIRRAEEAIEGLPRLRKRQVQRRGVDVPPYRSRVHFLIGQVDVAVPDVFVGVIADFFVPGDASYEMHFSPRTLRFGGMHGLELLQNFEASVVDRIRVIVRLGLPYKRFAAFPIQRFHLPRLGLNEINSPLVERHSRTGVIDFGNDRFASVGDVNDDKVSLGNAPQTHRICRIAVRHPMPLLALVMQHVFRFQIG